MSKLLVLLVLCASFALAQTQIQMQQQSPGGPRPAEPGKPKPSAQQMERGRKLLETAEAEAGGLQGGMRAYACLQLARAYVSSDKAKALELLESGMNAASAIDDDRSDARGRMQQELLQVMVPLAPQRAEELLAQMDPGDREPVLNALLKEYQKNNEWDHAIQLVYRIGQEKEIPYGAAAEIMKALPPERDGDLLQLFTASFASYRDHEHKNMRVGGGDFPDMVVQFWSKLPANQVRDAIHEVLKQSEDMKANISMSGDKGSASFASYHDYCLFQLLPVLKQVDPEEAKELLQKNDQMQRMLAQYPEGTESLMPRTPPAPPSESGGAKEAGKAPQPSGMSFMVGAGDRGPNAMGAEMALRTQQLKNITKELEDGHPNNALAQASAVTDLGTRAILYQTIARATVKKNPSVARDALSKLVELSEQLRDFQQLQALRTAGELYLQMNETDQAKKAVEHGFKLADNLFKTDTNADDPNKALKAYWPSAEAYRSFTRLAGQISPPYALTMLAEIGDPEMKVLAETSLAQGWLDVSRGPITVMTNRKNNQSIMVSGDSPQ